MIPTTFAAVLDSAPLSKPSDVLGIVVYASLFLLLTLVFFVVGKNFKAFLNGIAWLILLAFVGIVLIVIFQAAHPGQ